MIVGLSTIQDEGAGFRTRTFMPRWNFVRARMSDVVFDAVPVLEVRLIIGRVDVDRLAYGEAGSSFVVESRIPIDEFKQLTIREKNDLVLDMIFESIEAAYTHFGEPVPADVGRIWREAREAT